MEVKLARKLPIKKRAKRQLAGLYEVLKPRSYVTKSSPTKTIINEPGRAPVKIRDCDLAKSVTRALTVRKPSKAQPKRRRSAVSVTQPSEPTPNEQPGPSLVPAPPVPTSHEQPGSSLVSDS